MLSDSVDVGFLGNLGTVTDWIVILSVFTLLVVVYVSWLASYRTSKVSPVGTNLWFSLPSWAQIVAGFIISSVGAYLCYALWIPFPFAPSASVLLMLRAIGFVLVESGVMLWFWARWALGSMMGVSTASAVQLHVHHRLIQTGPYAFIRHPMYLGYWLLLLGLIVIYQTWTPLLLLILLVLSLTKRAQREDQALEEVFQEEWRAYANRVPMFLPHVASEHG